MKKISLLLPLLLSSICSISQNIKPFNLKDFEGKKIVSLFTSTVEMRGNLPGVKAISTNQYHTVMRSISFQNKGNDIVVDKIISNVKVKIQNVVTMEGEEFDTDKKFDRSSMASMIYGKYDNFIDKPFKLLYNQENHCKDTLADLERNNYNFNIAWGSLMMPFLQEDWIGFFQLSAPKEEAWKEGLTWQQILKRKDGQITKNENIINTYSVISIKGNEINIAFKGQNIPEQIMHKRGDGYVYNTLQGDKKANYNEEISYSIEQKADYEGSIKLDSRNNMILKMDVKTNMVKKIREKDSSVTGPETSYSVTIENTLEDLK